MEHMLKLKHFPLNNVVTQLTFDTRAKQLKGNCLH